MESIFANLFLALQKRIEALVGTDNKPIFKFIDRDFGQLEAHTGDNKPPVLWPACLIDIDDAVYKDEANSVQDAEVSVKIRIGFPAFSATSSKTPDDSKDKALKYWEIEYWLNRYLHHFNPNSLEAGDDERLQEIVQALNNVTGKLSRKKSTTEQRSDLINVRVLMYRIAINDTSCKPVTDTTLRPNIGFTFDINP